MSIASADRFIAQERRVSVGGVDTRYLEAGSGPVLVMLHGHEQNAASWRHVMPALARSRRVIAVSLPGHGDSAPPLGGYAPSRDIAPSVAAFLDALEIDTVDLVGHSVGGAVALHLALADPARVRTLTLVASAGLGRAVNPLIALDTLPGAGRVGDHAQPAARRAPAAHAVVGRDAVRPTLASARRLLHRGTRPRSPPRTARGLHRPGPRPVQRLRAAGGPARRARHPDDADPGRVGDVGPRPARPPRTARGPTAPATIWSAGRPIRSARGRASGRR